MIRVNADASVAIARLTAMIGRLENAAPVLGGRIARLAFAMLHEHFISWGASSGQPWAPLAPATIADKIRHGYGGMGTLRRTDLLFDSVTKPGAEGQVVRVFPGRLEISTLVFYASFHQYGTSRMPARHVVPDPVPQPFLNQVRQALKDWYLTGIGATP